MLLPLGISAARFVGADTAARDLLLDDMSAGTTRRFVMRLTLSIVVAIGFVVTLSGMWLLAGCAAIALKSGGDLGRMASRLRLLRAARELSPADLETSQP